VRLEGARQHAVGQPRHEDINVGARVRLQWLVARTAETKTNRVPVWLILMMHAVSAPPSPMRPPACDSPPT